MRTIFTAIFFIAIAFYAFMITPFGVYWTIKNMDENKPCYGIIIVYTSVIPVMIIGSLLGYIE